MRNVVHTIGAAFFSRSIMMIAPIVTIPITIRYLGEVRFGLWMTITSIMSMMLFADLGIGNGVLTEIGKLKGSDDLVGMRKVISTAYFVLGSSSLVALGVFWTIAQFIPWGRLVNAKDAATSADARIVGLVCISCFLLTIPLSLISKIQLGLQQGFVNEIWMSVSSLATMMMTLVAVYWKAPLGVLVLSVALTPLVFLLLNSITFFRRKERQGFVSRSMVDREMARTLLHIGGQFFLLSILTTITLNFDNLITAHLLGLEKVAVLEITAKPMKMALMLLTLLCLPFWPANGEALARGEFEWVRRITQKMVLLCFGATLIATFVLLFFGSLLYRLWIGSQFVLNHWLLLVLGIWALALGTAAPYFMVLNGAGKVWDQIKMWAIFLPVALVAKLFFTRQMGLPGIPLGGVIPYIFIIIPWTLLIYYKIIKPDKIHFKPD